MACVFSAAPVFAQPFAYVTVTHSDTCADPTLTSPCARGLIQVVNGATGQIVSTVDVWRNASGVSFGDAGVNPSGTRLYVAVISAGNRAGRLRPAPRNSLHSTRRH